MQNLSLSLSAKSNQRDSYGLSLIEILIALLIFLAFTSVSSFFLRETYKKNQLDVVVDEIKMAIQFAKLDALSHAHTVVLTTLPGHANWSDGLALCADNSVHQCHSGDALIRLWPWYHKGVSVSWVGFESKHYLRFTPDLIGRTANGHFEIKDDNRHSVRLLVNRLGRCQLDLPTTPHSRSM